MMPALSGEGFLEALTRQGLKVPVIVVSARTDAKQAVLRLGAIDCLAKPFPVALLEEKLERALGGGGGSSEEPETDPSRHAAPG